MVYEDFIEREHIINTSTKKEIEILNNDYSDDSDDEYFGYCENLKSISNEKIKYFDNNILPKIFIEGKYLQYYIKIKGKIKPAKFMNNLIKKNRR